MLFAQSIAQLEPSTGPQPVQGIHVLWAGPSPWCYSPTGYTVERRVLPKERKKNLVCDLVDSSALEALRGAHEARRPFAVLTARKARWPEPPSHGFRSVGPSVHQSEVFTIELDQQHASVHLDVRAASAFAFALREGKVVANSAPGGGALAQVLRGPGIDTVVIYAIQTTSLRYCVPKARTEDWSEAKMIAKGLQLPLRELTGEVDEYALAATRLLPGESLDPAEFARVADRLRAGLLNVGPPRPVDNVLLVRTQPGELFAETKALDSLLLLQLHPRWRRVLGFALFDSDGLVPGETYEYRVTGAFPAPDLSDRVYSFHTVPSSTALADDFHLGDLRLRLPEPTIVARRPQPESATALVALSRRGIALKPRGGLAWLGGAAGPHSLVADFAVPVSRVVLELDGGSGLSWHALAADGGDAGSGPVAGVGTALLSFARPASRLVLDGQGFLFALRVRDQGPDTGIVTLAAVTPDVVYADSPLPRAPMAAAATNLQRPSVVATTDAPPAIIPHRHLLGFEVRWLAALRNGVAAWPVDADASGPLDGNAFQLEHRQLEFRSDFPLEVLGIIGETAADATVWTRTLDLTISNVQRLRAMGIAPALLPALEAAIAATDFDAIVELGLAGPAAWRPLLDGDNWIYGARDAAPRTVDLGPHADVLEAFPEQLPQPASSTLFWRDMFDASDDSGLPVRRPTPPPGTLHQYRVRAVDLIGRVSSGATLTRVARLEKHVPPPQPVGWPTPEAAPSAPVTPAPRSTPPEAPIGVNARVLVRGAPDLTDTEKALLGASQTAVVLRWGWLGTNNATTPPREGQRDLDPYASEFRVYLDRPLDRVTGQLTNVAPTSVASDQTLATHTVSLTLDRPVRADAAAGNYLHAGHPFYLRTHSGGTAVTATLETRVPLPGGGWPVPVLGAVRIGIALTPELTRPETFAVRVAAVPITSDETYELVLRDVLLPTAAEPLDERWIGVTAADAEAYVDDAFPPTTGLRPPALPPAPAWPRPGNESPVAVATCVARYQERPALVFVPLLAEVHQIITAEPSVRPILFTLPLPLHLPPGLFSPGDGIRPERTTADDVFGGYIVSAGRILARPPEPRADGDEVEVMATAAASDRAAVITALTGSSSAALENKYVVYLAGVYPWPERIFQPVSGRSIPFGPVEDALPPRAGRHVYRARKADAAGHLSEGAAVAAVVVRVPSTAAGASPVRERRLPLDEPTLLRLSLPADEDLTHLLLFNQSAAPGAPSQGAAVLRVPSRPDLAIGERVRLRAPDGALLAPQVVALGPPPAVGRWQMAFDVPGGHAAAAPSASDLWRYLPLDHGGPAGGELRLWACSLTVDGIPSNLAGPFPVALPFAPLQVFTPMVSLDASGKRVFGWPATLPAGTDLRLEQSAATGTPEWQRVSPPINAAAGNYTFAPPVPGTFRYRFILRTLDGRTAESAATTA